MTHELSTLAAARGAAAWGLVRALARAAAATAATTERRAFAFDAPDVLRQVAVDDPAAAAEWSPGAGWQLRLRHDTGATGLVDLYLPVCNATPAAPIAIGHLGQSLDGFIATHSGDSQFVTGEENLRHMHRLRALCDAVVVGAGTIAADDPRLTTRHVPGPNPLRVVIDPKARLADRYHVFQDGAAPTLYAYARRHRDTAAARGKAEMLALSDGPQGLDLSELLAHLRGRGCARVFVEGGGVTVSAFLAAGLLDRVQVAVAPLFIGGGRPAFHLPAATRLSECHRPAYRVFRMGGDMLFDCDLRAAGNADADPDDHVVRVI